MKQGSHGGPSRREFVKGALLAGAGASLLTSRTSAAPLSTKGKDLFHLEPVQVIRLLHLNALYAHDEGYAFGTYPAPWPTPWRARCATLRRWIAHLDPDILTLNEITKGRRADTGAAVDMLADIVEGSALVHSVFGPACDEVMPFVSAGQYRGVALGNAVASRWPIDQHALSAPLTWVPATGIGRGFSSKRSALWTSIGTPTGPVSCVCTHLNSTGGQTAVQQQQQDQNRLEQMAEVMAFVHRQQQTITPDATSTTGVMPPILCGDMNDDASSASIRYACGQRPDRHGAFSPIAMVDAHSAANPDGIPHAWPAGDSRIDYVLVGPTHSDGGGATAGANAVGGQVVGCEAVGDDRFGEWCSDHLGVLVTLRAPGGDGCRPGKTLR